MVNQAYDTHRVCKESKITWYSSFSMSNSCDRLNLKFILRLTFSKCPVNQVFHISTYDMLPKCSMNLTMKDLPNPNTLYIDSSTKNL